MSGLAMYPLLKKTRACFISPMSPRLKGRARESVYGVLEILGSDKRDDVLARAA